MPGHLDQVHAEGVTDRDEFLAWVRTALYEAELALHNGDAGPRRALWSRNEPVSVLGAARNAHGQQEIGDRPAAQLHAAGHPGVPPRIRRVEGLPAAMATWQPDDDLRPSHGRVLRGQMRRSPRRRRVKFCTRRFRGNLVSAGATPMLVRGMSGRRFSPSWSGRRRCRMGDRPGQ